MKREKLGIAMACLWLAMLSYGSFPLELSAAGLAIPCVAYFAEYGEAWWNANFTAENAVRHLLWMTVCGIAICQIFRYLAAKESK